MSLSKTNETTEQPKASTPANSKIRMLSIDGGGIRGIIPATVIVYIEKQIRKITGNDDAKIGEYLDMIAGTSTGGILACLYLTPETTGTNKAKFSAGVALDLYLKNSILKIDFH